MASGARMPLAQSQEWVLGSSWEHLQKDRAADQRQHQDERQDRGGLPLKSVKLSVGILNLLYLKITLRKFVESRDIERNGGCAV
jgi:hypothetical protein